MLLFCRTAGCRRYGVEYRTAAYEGHLVPPPNAGPVCAVLRSGPHPPPPSYPTCARACKAAPVLTHAACFGQAMHKSLHARTQARTHMHWGSGLMHPRYGTSSARNPFAYDSYILHALHKPSFLKGGGVAAAAAAAEGVEGEGYAACARTLMRRGAVGAVGWT